MDVEEISQDGKRPHLILSDNNILASDHGIGQLEKIAAKGYRIDLNQGNSARLVTPEVAELFARIRWLKRIRFAADTPGQVAEVHRAMASIDKARAALGKAPAEYSIYTMLHGSVGECLKRLNAFRANKRVSVVAQPWRDFNNPAQTIPAWQKDMAHWANRHMIYHACPFEEFQPRKGFRCGEYLKK